MLNTRDNSGPAVKKWLPTVPLQSEAAECGIVSISALTAMFGQPVSSAALKARHGISTRGLAVSQLIHILRDAGFGCHAALVDFSRCDAIHVPCIALKDGKHFVVLSRRLGTLRSVFDPAFGWATISEDSLQDVFSGPVVELSSLPEVPLVPTRSSAYLLEWLRKRLPWRSLLIVFGLAAIAHLLLIAVPMGSKAVIDQAVGGANGSLVALAMGAYIVIAMLGVLGQSVARRSAARVSARMGAMMISDVAARVLSKPVSFLSRFSPVSLTGKITTVRQFQELALRASATTSVSAFVCAFAFCIAYWLSPPIALLLLGFALVSTLADQIASRYVSAASERMHRASIVQQGGLNEMVRAAPAIKAYCAESSVMALRAREAQAVGLASISLDDARRRQDVVRSTLDVAEQSAFLGLAVWLLVSEALTFGGFVALSLYRQLCAAGIQEIRDAMSSAHAAHIACGRLEDIVESDVNQRPPVKQVGEGSSSIHVVDVSYRYSSFDPFVFEGLSLEIAAGEHVAIVGPSGCGKSTLAKLLVGALSPTRGEIRFGPTVLDERSSDLLLRGVGTVMQGDHLLSGSIRDNIDFYRGLSDEQIRSAAAFAEIDGMIDAMPMRYETPISDDFAGLSGGQRQRLLIARAVAGRPRIMIMDEATSYLDVGTERAIGIRLRTIGATRVVFAHRSETIRSADRVIELGVACSRIEQRQSLDAVAAGKS